MQRGTYVISLSAQAVEGALVVRGEAHPAYHQTLFVPATDPLAAGGPTALLGAFLDQAGWERGLTTLVLPTAFISQRRLQFQFADARKVRQVLPLEIQSELLGPLEEYAHDAQILPRPDGRAEALVFLTPTTDLEPVAEVIEQHQLLLHRVTFAAQALAESVPVASPSHFCVYLGSDESSVAHLVDGRLAGVQALGAHPGAELDALAALGPGSPLEHLRALPQTAEGDEKRGAIRERLHESLAAAVAEANRFLRIHGAGAPHTVSLHGLFAQTCAWREETGEVEFRPPEGTWPGTQRTHLGLLESLMEQPRPIAGARGTNLRRRVGTWMATVRDLRWPLVAAGVLLAMLAGVGGTGFVWRASALESRLARVEGELRRDLGIRGPVTTATVNAALSRVQEQVDRLRRDQAAVAYLEGYHYNMLRLLTDLSEAVHAEPALTVENLSYTRDRITVSGITPSYAASEALKSRVVALERFKGQTVKVTNAASGQVIRYRLTVEK